MIKGIADYDSLFFLCCYGFQYIWVLNIERCPRQYKLNHTYLKSYNLFQQQAGLQTTSSWSHSCRPRRSPCYRQRFIIFPCHINMLANSKDFLDSFICWGGGQTRFFNLPSVKHWYTQAFFLGRTSTYLLVILVGARGDRTRNPWVSSRVFYHWAKSPCWILFALNFMSIYMLTVVKLLNFNKYW